MNLVSIKTFTQLNIIFFFLTFMSSNALAFDNSIYAYLLGKYVHSGSVDYPGLKNEEATLDSYLALIAETNPGKLSRNDQLAFYLNAYNAYTIKLILDNFENGSPPSSIKDVGGFFSKPWSIKFCKIGGKFLTLDNIEHDIIRPTFQDARIHFAANCASRSCPPLRSSPYEGKSINQQLDDNVRAYLHDTNQNYLKNNILYVSKIFDWYKEDFHGTIEFFKKYAQGELKERLGETNNFKIKYLKYNWALNGL